MTRMGHSGRAGGEPSPVDRDGRGSGASAAQRPPFSVPYRHAVQELLALVAFSFVCSVTPGPNNVLLWASGAAFGLRRTLPHVVGTAVGIGCMALGAAAGLAALISVVPALAVAMRVVGSVYLLWLAWQIARSGAVRQGVIARPMGVIAAAVFQLVNPKAWVFALGAVTTFRPADLPPVIGTVAMAAIMMAIVIPSALLWAGLGGTMARLLVDDDRRRLVSGVLAGFVAATVVLVWI
jgi:threonine/homoserine/homoserine lactone efflux protein